MVSKTQTEDYLRKTKLPLATKSYAVISHGDIIDAVREMLAKHGFIITNELYKAESNGDVALGFMQIETLNDPDMAMTFNWNNSYNKMVRFSCSIGGFIYDNQVPFVSTNNQASWNRKHTGTALEETMEVIEAMVASADAHFAQIVAMKNKFKSISISRKEYAKLLGLLYFDKQVISSEQVNVIKREYDKPSFDYNDKGTLWEVYKMIMFGIVDQAPKNWYKQQMDINSYVQVLYNIASIELENENEADELELDSVTDDSEVEVNDNQLLEEKVEDSEMESIDNLIQAQNMVQDAKTVALPEPSLFEDVAAKKERLEEIRTELDNESISYGELVELQGMTEFIEEGDVQLLEAAGVPEFKEPTIDLSDLEGEYSLDEMPAVIETIQERIDEVKEEARLSDEPFDAEVEVLTTDELVERYGDQVDLTEFDGEEDLILPTKMSEEQIEMVKEEHGVVETDSPNDELIGATENSPESLFDMMDEYDELEEEETPWFEDTVTEQEMNIAPSLIPDSMREAVSEILADKYQNKRTVVNTIEEADYMVFELDSKEFFVVDK